VHKAFAPAIVGMSGQIHADFLRLLWVLADEQMRSYYESMGKEDKIGTEAFRWARAKVFNCNMIKYMYKQINKYDYFLMCILSGENKRTIGRPKVNYRINELIIN